MKAKARTEWRGLEQMSARLDAYGQQVLTAVQMIAGYWAGVFEAYAKENAPWTDRTSNARQGLHTFTQELGKETVAVYLAHQMEYGKWLEVRWAGKYAIIWPTIEAHLPEIERMLKEVFS